MKTLFVYPKAKIWNTPVQIPLGIATLGAVLLKAGHEVKVCDTAVNPLGLKRILKKEKFDLIGLSATSPLINNAWELAAYIKSHSRAPIVIGGTHVSALPEESLEKDNIDYVVRGEGEETILEICEMLSGKRKKEEILGLSYKKQGKIVHNPPRPLKINLDDLPFPAHELFDINKYSNTQPVRDRQAKHTRAFYLMTSRGCPYGCVYCYKGICGRLWRPKSIDKVIAEWEYLVNDLKATEIGVQDDVFNLNRERAIKICDLLIEKGLNRVPWIINNGIRADKVDLELLKKMKQVGCKRVAFGVENGSAKILKNIKKEETLSQIEKAFRLAKKAGLKTMNETIKFAIKLNPETAIFSIAMPFPGAPLYEEVVKNGQLLNTNWEDYRILEGKGMFILGQVNPELVSRKWHEAYRRFYLRPSRVLPEVGRLDNWLNIKALFKAAKNYFWVR